MTRLCVWEIYIWGDVVSSVRVLNWNSLGLDIGYWTLDRQTDIFSNDTEFFVLQRL